MDVSAMIARMKTHPRFPQAGMILCHNGVVRGTSRDGRPTSGLRVAVDHQRLQQILTQQKARSGIVEILVEIAEDQDLAVGDDVMVLVVAGDVRENVINVLSDTLNAIKSTVTRKTEFFVAKDETP